MAENQVGRQGGGCLHPGAGAPAGQREAHPVGSALQEAGRAGRKALMRSRAQATLQVNRSPGKKALVSFPP